MGVLVEEGVHCFHSGHTTSIHSSFQGLTLTPMLMSMPMPMPTTTTRASTTTTTTTSTRYRLQGTLIIARLPRPVTIISRIIIATTTIPIIQIITIIIAITITTITITTTTIIRFKNITIRPEPYAIETPVSVIKVTRVPSRNDTQIEEIRMK